MHCVSQYVDSKVSQLIEEVAVRAREASVFNHVETHKGMVTCRCAAQPDASYRIEIDGQLIAVCWVSSDRYLSQSIEAELMWTGDDLEELVDEERIDQGFTRGELGKIDHHRNAEKLFTFRSSIPIEMQSIDPCRDAPDLLKCLLAYEAAFRDLGDMKPKEDD